MYLALSVVLTTSQLVDQTIAASDWMKDTEGHHKKIERIGAEGIVKACQEDPLFIGNNHVAEPLIATIYLALLFSFRESSYTLDICGDNCTSHGPFQSKRPWPYTVQDLHTSWYKATRNFLKNMRESMMGCPNHPFAIYAGGGCDEKKDKAAIDISRGRIQVFKRFIAENPVPQEELQQE